MADVIYGTIKVGGNPLASHEITVKLGEDNHPGKTNDRGSYSIKMDKKGRCTLSLTYRGEELSYTVYSQDKPARYDLVVVQEKDRWILRRK